MLQPSTISFLSELEKNNNREWFDKNRKVYEAAKADFEQLVSTIHSNLTSLEPAMADQKAKDTIFRIFRDVRFSKDKTPYKPHFSAYFSRAGRKAPDAGIYMHLQPGGKSFIATGMWTPEAPLLKAVRQEIDYNLKDFEAILKNAAFKKHFKTLEGEKLKTLPKDYTADNPAIEYLKMKSFMVSTPVSDKELASKAFAHKVTEMFAVSKPLVDFLNRALD